MLWSKHANPVAWHDVRQGLASPSLAHVPSPKPYELRMLMVRPVIVRDRMWPAVPITSSNRLIRPRIDGLWEGIRAHNGLFTRKGKIQWLSTWVLTLARRPSAA